MAGQNITILQWNINSTNTNKTYLQHNISTYKQDIIILQETLDKKEKNDNLHGYSDSICIPCSTQQHKKTRA